MNFSLSNFTRTLKSTDAKATGTLSVCFAGCSPGGTITLDSVREAVTTLEDTERIARRVLGGAHPTTVPTTVDIEQALRAARAALRAHESRRDAAHDWIRRHL